MVKYPYCFFMGVTKMEYFSENPNIIPNYLKSNALAKDVAKFEKKGGVIIQMPASYKKRTSSKFFESYGTKKPYFYESNNILVRRWCKQVAGRAMMLAEKTRLSRSTIDKYIKGFKPICTMEMERIHKAILEIENFEVSELNERY